MQETNESVLNGIAAQLIPLLAVQEDYWQSNISQGSFSDVMEVDLTEYLSPDPIIERDPDYFNGYDKISIRSDQLYCFTNNNDKQFHDLVIQINGLSFFKQRVSLEFLEEQVMLWLFENSKIQMANNNLIEHLKTLSEKVIEQRTFYFPVLNLHIHEPFVIGHVGLTYFSKAYFDTLQNRNKNIDQQAFDELYRKHQGHVFATYQVVAEPRLGQEIAYKQCCLAIDVLKMFCPTLYYPSKKLYIDLADRININYETHTLSTPARDPYLLRIETKAKNDPFRIDAVFFANVIKKRLPTLSGHLLKSQPDELTGLITQSIQFFSYAISTFDLHLRVGHLITIFESLLLEEDRKHKMEAHVKKRVVKILQNGKGLDEMLNNMYQVRHKMVHKAIKLTIDLDELALFQRTAVNVLMNQCYLNQRFKNKEELINFLDT